MRVVGPLCFWCRRCSTPPCPTLKRSMTSSWLTLPSCDAASRHMVRPGLVCLNHLNTPLCCAPREHAPHEHACDKFFTDAAYVAAASRYRVFHELASRNHLNCPHPCAPQEHLDSCLLGVWLIHSLICTVSFVICFAIPCTRAPC